jgi:hypothetical protein
LRLRPFGRCGHGVCASDRSRSQSRGGSLNAPGSRRRARPDAAPARAGRTAFACDRADLSACGRRAHDLPEPFARQTLIHRDVLVARAFLKAGEGALEAQRAGARRERRADDGEFCQSGPLCAFLKENIHSTQSGFGSRIFTGKMMEEGLDGRTLCRSAAREGANRRGAWPGAAAQPPQCGRRLKAIAERRRCSKNRGFRCQ